MKFRVNIHSLYVIVNFMFLYVFSIPAATGQGFVINEVDYDQTGPDEFEFIELFNGTNSQVDLLTVCVELIDQNGNVYRTINFTNEVIPIGNYFVICGSDYGCDICDFVLPDNPTSWIQNGVQDAILLRNCGGADIDRLCYEGSSGNIPCEGIATTIGDNSTEGSLSRVPNGIDTDENDRDFDFVCTTPGAPNINVSTTSGCQLPFENCDTDIQFQLDSGALYMEDGTEGIVLKNEIGRCYRISLDAHGNLLSKRVTCPQ